MAELQPTQERSILARIFLSPQEPRLRAGWRLLIHTILLLILFMVFGTIISILGIFLGQFLQRGAFILGQIAELIAVTGSVYIARRWLDRRSFESLGLKLDGRALLDVLAGIGITFVQMGFIYVVMLGFGWLTFQGFAWQFDPIPAVITGVLIFFIAFLLVGWNEELLFRGYHLQTIASGINLFWGVILSSVIFGFAHIGNPNSYWLTTTAGIFFAGIYLAYGYVRTKQLWLSIGLHIGWNFFEGVVFGFPVSGLNIYPLTRISVHGPELWTGGAFGPEAGLIVLPSLIVGGLLIYLYTMRRAK